MGAGDREEGGPAAGGLLQNWEGGWGIGIGGNSKDRLLASLASVT